MESKSNKGCQGGLSYDGIGNIKKRREIYTKELENKYIGQKRKADTESRLSEVENLIFIITTNDIDIVK